MALYRAWVPNTIGRLSFSIAGQTSYPSKIVFSGDLEDAGTKFLCFQRRNLSDTSVPFASEWRLPRYLLDRYWFHKDGTFFFACCLVHDRESDQLSGKVFCFPRSDWQRPKQFLRETIFGLGQVNKPFDFDRLASRIGPYAFASARVGISRNGAVEIDVTSMPSSADIGKFSDIEGTIASQIFFSVRDIFHVHRFHAPSTDRIIDAYPFDPDNPSEWKKQVNFALARKAINLRRRGRHLSIHRATGIIAYLQSFRLNVMTDNERNDLPFTIDQFLASLKSYEPIANVEEAHSLVGRSQFYVNRILAFAAIFITVFVTLGTNSNVYGKMPKWQQSIIDYSIANFVPTAMIGLIILGIASLFIPYQRGYREKVAKNISRLAVTFHRKRFGWAEIVIGAIGLTISTWGASKLLGF